MYDDLNKPLEADIHTVQQSNELDSVLVNPKPIASLNENSDLKTDSALKAVIGKVAEKGFEHASENLDNDKLKEFQDTAAEALIKTIKAEERKQEQEVQKAETGIKKEKHRQKADKWENIERKWENRERWRNYCYNGVKPIMMFVNIQEPMNIPLLYLLTLILLPVYLIAKLIKGTVGTLLSGVNDERPKAVKGFCLTLLGLLVFVVAAIAVVFLLKWAGWIK